MPGHVRRDLKRTVPQYASGRNVMRANVGKRRGAAMAASRSTRLMAGSYAGETKYFDCGINTLVTGAADAWTATEVPCDNYVNSSGTAAAYTDSALLPSAGGSAYGQINGNRFHLKKLRVRGTITVGAQGSQADPSNARPYRLLLVHDSGPNGNQAQGEDILQDIGAGETLYSFKRMASQGSRFRILKDQIGVLHPTVAFTDGANVGTQGFSTAEFSFQYQPTAPLNISVKSNASSTPTIANLVDGNIFLLLGTNGKQMTIVASSRAYYSDK